MPRLDFDGHNTLYATHGLHAYAAKCPPQLVKYGLSYYSKRGETVLDPMVGSGTTLVEARLMGRNAVGYDIDPLASLIAKVKSTEVDDLSIQEACTTVSRRCKEDIDTWETGVVSDVLHKRAVPPDFHNRDYWFNSDVATSLAILSYHIGETPMQEDVQDFLWVAFSSLILARTSVANARDIIHSRHHHWEHPQSPNILQKFERNVEQMRRRMAEFRRLCRRVPSANIEVKTKDARCLPLEDEQVDLVFTSPPYATALDYPRAHFLAIPWMSKVLEIDLQAYMERAPTYIGSERGQIAGGFTLDQRLAAFDTVQSVVTKLTSNSIRQAKLLQRYFIDMYEALGEMGRVLKTGRSAIIVVCPSHIRKVEVPTHEVLIEMARLTNLKLKSKHIRTINERLRILPYMKEAFGKRMSTEYVLVFKKT